jgi:hypothetical protein
VSPSAASEPGVAATRRRQQILWVGVAVTVATVVGLAISAGARFGSATMGLLAVTAALGLCLRSLYNMAWALRQPSVEVALERQGTLDVASQRHLREEKRRLVRAINELTFDHEMGKLSKEDYDAVRQVYELKAVEVIRALESDVQLHPALREQLLRLELMDAVPAEAEAKAAEPESDSASEPDSDEDSDEASAAEPDAAPDAAPAPGPAGKTCAACDSANDVDARFCKKCGKELSA